VQVGLPSYAEMTEAVLDYKLRAAGYDVRSFITSALEGRDEGSETGAGDHCQCEPSVAVIVHRSHRHMLTSRETAGILLCGSRRSCRKKRHTLHTCCNSNCHETHVHVSSHQASVSCVLIIQQS